MLSFVHCRLLSATLVSVFWLVEPIGGVAVYEFSAMTAQPSQRQFSTTNKSECFSACSGNVSAASFSKYLAVCVTSMCANIRLIANALWTTYLCVDTAAVKCDYPEPTLEWILTDACTNLNSGTVNAGWKMKQAYNLTEIQNTVMYATNTKLPYAGHPIQYGNRTGYHWMTDKSTVTINSGSSLTFFGFFILYQSSQPSFPIIEFGLFNGVYSAGPSFWILAGGLFFNFESSQWSCTGRCFNYYSMNINVAYKWTHVALTYDDRNSRFDMYLNGSNVGAVNATIDGSYTGNVVLTGGWPKPMYSSLLGSTYCLKVFSSALSQSQINAVAKACLSGQIQLF